MIYIYLFNENDGRIYLVIKVTTNLNNLRFDYKNFFNTFFCIYLLDLDYRSIYFDFIDLTYFLFINIIYLFKFNSNYTKLYKFYLFFNLFYC